MPTYGPTYPPTRSPTIKPTFVAPSSKPTMPPAPQPTVEPTPRAPTLEPTSDAPTLTPFPTGECLDDATWFKKNDPSKDCDWVAASSPTRCAVKGDDRAAYQACYRACDTCGDECSADDSTDWIIRDEDDKNCDWVAEAYVPRCGKTSLDDTFAFQACPYACRTCLQPNCDDSMTWSASSDETKDCSWVAEASNQRCTKYGVDVNETVLAFVACPQSCRVCPGFLGETCDNDATWYKKGEPSKNCDWVAQSFPRCRAKGFDDTWAYQNCRLACDTC